jgi:alkaline phosphatase
VDVNIYASSSKDAWPLVGNHENTEVGQFLADYLDLDVKNITKRLQSSSAWSFAGVGGVSSPDRPFSWLGNPLGENVRTEGLDTYHGEFRKRSMDVDGMEKLECGCGGTH